VLSRRTSDGRNAVEIKNAYGETLLTTLWFRDEAVALDLEAVDDADGNGVPEVAVLSRRLSDDLPLAEIKNAAGAGNPNTVFFPEGFTALDMTEFDDLDGNGVEEVAGLLIRDSDGRLLVRSLNAAGNAQGRNYWLAP
jgi:hypothetical protein